VVDVGVGVDDDASVVPNEAVMVVVRGYYYSWVMVVVAQTEVVVALDGFARYCYDYEYDGVHAHDHCDHDYVDDANLVHIHIDRQENDVHHVVHNDELHVLPLLMIVSSLVLALQRHVLVMAVALMRLW
jgi:hypothetical protein